MYNIYSVATFFYNYLVSILSKKICCDYLFYLSVKDLQFGLKYLLPLNLYSTIYSYILICVLLRVKFIIKFKLFLEKLDF